MSEQLRRVQARARALAELGNFIGWRSIAFELSFEPGYRDALEWLFSFPAQEELDTICREARARNALRQDPEAA